MTKLIFRISIKNNLHNLNYGSAAKYWLNFIDKILPVPPLLFIGNFPFCSIPCMERSHFNPGEQALNLGSDDGGTEEPPLLAHYYTYWFRRQHEVNEDLWNQAKKFPQTLQPGHPQLLPLLCRHTSARPPCLLHCQEASKSRLNFYF